jgi:hypothetical protein
MWSYQGKLTEEQGSVSTVDLLNKVGCFVKKIDKKNFIISA